MSDIPSPILSPPRKTLFRNRLAALGLRKSILVGQYDYLPDHVPSQDEDLLGIEQRADIGDFNLDMEGSDGSDDDNVNPGCQQHEPYFFHATFDDKREFRPLQEQQPERVVSSYFQRSPRKRCPVLSPRASRVSRRGRTVQESDSDTSGTADTEDESFDLFNKAQSACLPKQRTIRFADEEGLAIETVYITDRDEEEDDGLSRIIVLLLSPKRKRFEFLHLQYEREERTQLSEACKQFGEMASDPSFITKKYVGLCRPARNGQELINSLALQDYDMEKDEILVAIPSGMKSKHIVKLSQPLLSDRNVLKTVKRKMRNGFAVQNLHKREGHEANPSLADTFENARDNPAVLSDATTQSELLCLGCESTDAHDTQDENDSAQVSSLPPQLSADNIKGIDKDTAVPELAVKITSNAHESLDTSDSRRNENNCVDPSPLEGSKDESLAESLTKGAPATPVSMEHGDSLHDGADAGVDDGEVPSESTGDVLQNLSKRTLNSINDMESVPDMDNYLLAERTDEAVTEEETEQGNSQETAKVSVKERPRRDAAKKEMAAAVVPGAGVKRICGGSFVAEADLGAGKSRQVTIDNMDPGVDTSRVARRGGGDDNTVGYFQVSLILYKLLSIGKHSKSKSTRAEF